MQSHAAASGRVFALNATRTLNREPEEGRVALPRDPGVRNIGSEFLKSRRRAGDAILVASSLTLDTFARDGRCAARHRSNFEFNPVCTADIQ